LHLRYKVEENVVEDEDLEFVMNSILVGVEKNYGLFLTGLTIVWKGFWLICWMGMGILGGFLARVLL